MVFIKSQRDVSIMVDIINNFSVVSSARVNWAKSEALAVGEGVASGVKLPRWASVEKGWDKVFGCVCWKQGLYEKKLGKHIGNS